MIVPSLRDFAESEPADLIIMSTHGHGGLKRAWLGSVTDALLRASTIPMLLVRPAEDLGNAAEATPAVEVTSQPAPPKPEVPTPRRFAHMLIAVDGSTIADDAARRACELASLHGAKVTLLRVVRPPIHTTSAYMPHMMRLNREEVERRETEATVQLQELASQLREDGLRVGERVVVDYHPAEAILREADDLDADVIALATRGHGGFKRLVLGSVADKVIRGSILPVFVVPAHVAESLEDEKQREEEHAITVV
jgi:nucleotide-binding universal stress UspA family protein